MGQERQSNRLKKLDVTASIREIILHLSRGNEERVEALRADVTAYLKGIIESGQDPSGAEFKRAQQTMFAMDELAIQLEERNVRGAAAAARDAVKEWN